jgi:hypothetical protein
MVEPPCRSLQPGDHSSWSWRTSLPDSREASPQLPSKLRRRRNRYTRQQSLHFVGLAAFADFTDFANGANYNHSPTFVNIDLLATRRLLPKRYVKRRKSATNFHGSQKPQKRVAISTRRAV